MRGNVGRLLGLRGTSGALWLILGLGLVSAPTACGEDKDDPIVGPSATGGSGARGGRGGSGGSTSGRGGSTGESGGGGEGTTVPGAPDVRITSPEALAAPDDGSVLIAPEVEVTCDVAQSGDADSEPVDPATVKLEMLDASDAVVDSKPAVATGSGDEFSATFILTPLENGRVSFRCTASDTSTPPLTASDRVDTFVDHGPAIELVEPAPDSAYPQMGAFHVEFNVVPEPLVRGDDGADVGTVTLEIAGTDIELTQDSPGVYTASVDPADEALFQDALVGDVPVVIRASNQRVDPGPATRELRYGFVVDGEGPVIEVVSPSNQDVVGGEVRLRFTVVDDAAGVDVDTVVVEINNQEFHFVDGTPWGHSGNDFELIFDSRQIEGSVAQATVNIEATDLAGNAAPGESLILYLDNKPPIVDLDPPTVREKIGSATVYCSLPFDPLGTSPDDLSVVPGALAFTRALVWDETNSVIGLPNTYMAGADQDSVYLYLQPDTSKPLIVDGDDVDTLCDSIYEPSIAEAPNGLPKLHLKAVPQTGSAWFGRDTDDRSPDDPPHCNYQGNAIPPPFLCANQLSDLTRVTQHQITASEPVVYGVGDLGPIECTGGSWEIQQYAQEGWICLAAIAADGVGNIAVSRPLRLCYDNPSTPAHPTCVNLANPPSCTNGCSLPRTFADRGDRIITTMR